MKIVFATNNANKIREIAGLVNSKYQILSLSDINLYEDIPEEEETLEGNALSKAKYIYAKTGLNVFADDTGLELNHLGGKPGVFSARYAGPENSSDKNMDKLLLEMAGVNDRSAQFRTIIALILDGKEHLFEGVVTGNIIKEKRGSGGFGYDPIFMAEGMKKSFAEISIEEKNRISHRALATKKLIDFLDAACRQ